MRGTVWLEGQGAEAKRPTPPHPGGRSPRWEGSLRSQLCHGEVQGSEAGSQGPEAPPPGTSCSHRTDPRQPRHPLRLPLQSGWKRGSSRSSDRKQGPRRSAPGPDSLSGSLLHLGLACPGSLPPWRGSKHWLSGRGEEPGQETATLPGSGVVPKACPPDAAGERVPQSQKSQWEALPTLPLPECHESPAALKVLANPAGEKLVELLSSGF